MKKGRDFTFGGKIQAGKLQYYGKEYYFHYDPFIIDLLNVDSVSFYADSFEPDEQGETYLVRVKNVLEQVTRHAGDRRSPATRAACSRRSTRSSPSSTARRRATCSTTRRTSRRACTTATSSTTSSDPFQIDSLDNFTNKGLNFTGVLVSARHLPRHPRTARACSRIIRSASCGPPARPACRSMVARRRSPTPSRSTTTACRVMATSVYLTTQAQQQAAGLHARTAPSASPTP